MPELPEVETIARQIRQKFVGRRISRIEANQSKIFQNVTAEEFSRMLLNRKLERVGRYGKYLYWVFDDISVLFHLGMSGIFIKEKSFSRYPQHIHICFNFENGSRLYFQDVRKFSKISLHKNSPSFTSLGIDPTQPNFSLSKLKNLLISKSAAIKPFLMDQQLIAGIGNIYANEILFDAKINPQRRASSLSAREIQRLHHSIANILRSAIEHFGTSYSAYRTLGGEVGENQKFLKVYQRKDLQCPNCGTSIAKTVMNSRSTFYCKKCQAMK